MSENRLFESSISDVACVALPAMFFGMLFKAGLCESFVMRISNCTVKTHDYHFNCPHKSMVMSEIPETSCHTIAPLK